MPNNTFLLITLKVMTSYNQCMKNLQISEIRYRNALYLRALAGGVTEFALRVERSQPQMSALISDRPSKPIGGRLARHFEICFKKPDGWMDVPHPDLWAGSDDGLLNDQAAEYVVGEKLPGSPSAETHVIIPRYNAAGGCGDTYLNDHIEVKGGLAFRRDWLKLMGWDPDWLLIVYGKKESMWPTINDGSVLMVNLKEKTPESGMVYLMNWYGEERIKRLFRDGPNTYRVVSDNPNKTLYPDEHINFEQEPGVQIIGRICWQAGVM